MKKLLCLVFGLMLLSSVAFGQDVFDLRVVILKTLGISVTPTTLSTVVPLASNSYIAGTPTDLEVPTPALTLKNVGILTHTQTLTFHDDGLFTYLDTKPTTGTDQAGIAFAITSTAEFTDPFYKIEDTLHTAPLGVDPLAGNQGVGITSGESTRCAMMYAISDACTVLGEEQTIAITFGAIETP